MVRTTAMERWKNGEREESLRKYRIRSCRAYIEFGQYVDCVAMALCGNGSVWKWLCVAMALCDNGSVWQWLCVAMALFGSGSVWQWLCVAVALLCNGSV